MKLVGDLYSAREIINLRIHDFLFALPMGIGLLEINGPLWSLYIEAKLYVLFACIYYLQQGKRSITILATLLVVAYAGWHLNPEFARYAAIWLIGCCAYYFWAMRTNVLRSRIFLVCGGSILLIVLIDLFVRIWSVVTPTGRVISADVLIAVVIAWVLFKLRPSSRVGQQIANYSYTLYVVHFPILLLFQSILVKTESISMGLTIVFSILAGVAALGIARMGERLEDGKNIIQQYLLTVWSSITKKYYIFK